MKLHKERSSLVGRPGHCYLKDLQKALLDGPLATGRYLIVSKRDDTGVSHASAIVDGHLLDGPGNTKKPLRIKAIYRLEGDIRRARAEAAKDANTIWPNQQPVARGELSKLCKAFCRQHRLAPGFDLVFYHPSGRKVRKDKVVEWYPLELARQLQAAMDANVCGLLDGLEGTLRTDITS